MGNYKLVALDMDGTLLNREGLISQENLQAVNAAIAKGVYVIIATGRSRKGIEPIIQQLDRRYPVIVANGGEIWDQEDQLVERHVLAAQTITALHALAVQHDVTFWGYSVEAGEFNNHHFPNNVADHTWLKFGFQFQDSALCALFWREIPQLADVELSNSHPLNIEVNPKGINKGHSLRRVCDRLGVSIAETIAIGDSMNDISMIQTAGVGIAMGNAQSKVKEIADWVTATNHEHGVAQALHHWLHM